MSCANDCYCKISRRWVPLISLVLMNLGDHLGEKIFGAKNSTRFESGYLTGGLFWRWIKTKPPYVQPQEPYISAKVSFVIFD